MGWQIAVLVLILILPLLIAHLALVNWAFHDAKRRGKSGVSAALLVLLLGFPTGLIIWLLVRPKQPA